MFTEVSKSTKQHADNSGNLWPLNKHLPWHGRSNGSTLLKIPPCNTARSALHKTGVKRQKGRVTEQRTANVQMSRTVEAVKACQPHLGPDYMSRAGPVSRAASVCRDDFLPGITWGEPARLLADGMNHGRPGVSLILVWRRANEPGWQTRLHGKISARLAGIPRTAIPGSRLTGPARLSCNREVDYYGV